MPDTTYPRDLVGYGRNPPDPRWPGEARVCVQFVINYEEGGENNILHGDAGSEALLSEIVGAASWPGQRHMNMESIYEYGSRAGFWRLWRMFTDRGLPVTVYGVATALMRNPGAVAAMKDAVLPALLVVDHELHADACPVRPARMRRVAAIADEVAGIGGRHGQLPR